MAQRVEVIIVDDIDGSGDATTVRFGLDGSHYEIDLTEQRARQLRTALDPYVAAGRRRTTSNTRPQKQTAAHRAHLRQVRQWAQANGHKVSQRGRIPAAVSQAYTEAHRVTSWTL